MDSLSAKLRVCAYARVSTDKDDQANSLENQTTFFARYISQNPDWEFVGVYPDEGLSGTDTTKRKHFNLMIEKARAGRIDIILTKEVSRFARNTVDTLSYVRELRNLGVAVIFLNDNINSLDPDAELRLTIMASIAQEESRKTSERVKWGQKRQMEKGVVFGRDLVGYTVKDGKMTINSEEAEIVKLIYHKYLHEEKGTHVIARELYEAGISAKRMKRWTNTVILRMLRNEKYAGDLFQQKTYTPDYLDHKKKYNRGQREMVCLYDHHEAIIDRDTWNAVQVELARRSPCTEQKARHAQRYWCSGKLKCGECGSTFVRRARKTDYGLYVAWRCYQSATYGAPKKDDFGNLIGCNGEAINDKALLYCANYAIKQIQVNHDRIIKELMQDIRTVFRSPEKIDTIKLEKVIEDLEEKKVKILDLRVDDIINDEDCMVAIAAYNEKIAATNKKIQAANAQNMLYEEQADKINEYIDEIKEVLKMDADNEAVYRELTKQIQVFNGGVIIFYLKCVPFGIRLQYATQGKGERYAVKVTDVSFTEPLADE